MGAKSLTEIKKELSCPTHRRTLQFDPSIYSTEGVPWPDSQITCPEGCVFAIERGIPRFVSRDSYASAFGYEQGGTAMGRRASLPRHSQAGYGSGWKNACVSTCSGSSRPC